MVKELKILIQGKIQVQYFCYLCDQYFDTEAERDEHFKNHLRMVS